jgi:hypothetical protein
MRYGDVAYNASKATTSSYSSYSGYSGYSRAAAKLQQLQQSYSDPSDHASTYGTTVPATVQLYSAATDLQCATVQRRGSGACHTPCGRS